MQVKSLDHIHIYAATPEESASFFETHFAAKTVARNTNINGDTRIFLALGGQILVIGDFPKGMVSASPPSAGDGAYRNGYGISHIGLRVEDVREAIAELSAAGVEILGQPILEESGLVYAYIAAPDGVVIELTQYESAS